MNEGCVFKQIVKVVSDRNQKKPVVHYEKVALSREISNGTFLMIFTSLCEYCHQQFSEFQSSPIFFTTSAIL